MEDQNLMHDQNVQPFDPAIMGNIKRILQIQSESGKPQSFEIYVDGLRVVPRTQNVSLFDSYKEFIHQASKIIVVTVFRGIKTPNCTSHVFRIAPKEAASPSVTQEQALQPQFLNGPEAKAMFQEMLEKDRLVNKVAQLEEKLQDREKKLADAEEYAAKLQDGIERVKLEIESSKSVWGERLLDLAKNPPHWVQMMIASKGNYQPINGPEQLQGEVSFRPKQKGLSEEDQRYVQVLQQMEEVLDENELDLVMQINDKLIQETKLIPDVAELVGIKTN